MDCPESLAASAQFNKTSWFTSTHSQNSFCPKARFLNSCQVAEMLQLVGQPYLLPLQQVKILRWPWHNSCLQVFEDYIVSINKLGFKFLRNMCRSWAFCLWLFLSCIWKASAGMQRLSSIPGSHKHISYSQWPEYFISIRCCFNQR